MNSPSQQGNRQDNKQGTTAGGDRGGQSSVLVDSGQELETGDEEFAFGEVRRADRARNREGSASRQSQQQGDTDANENTGT